MHLHRHILQETSQRPSPNTQVQHTSGSPTSIESYIQESQGPARETPASRSMSHSRTRPRMTSGGSRLVTSMSRVIVFYTTGYSLCCLSQTHLRTYLVMAKKFTIKVTANCVPVFIYLFYLSWYIL